MLQLSVRAQLLELVLRPLERARPLAAVPQEEEVVAVPVAEPGPPMPKAIRLAKSTRILPVSSFLVFPRFSTHARLARAGGAPPRQQPATLSIILWPRTEKSKATNFSRRFQRTRRPLPHNP